MRRPITVAWLAAALTMPVAAQVTSRVSVASNGGQGDNNSGWPSRVSISDDGRYVAFSSYASNLVPGDTGVPDVFVRDRVLGTTVKLSFPVSGSQANHVNDTPSISGDGRSVAFESFASNLVLGDTNGVMDIFFRTPDSGPTDRVSVATGGIQANGQSHDPTVSFDGRLVAFSSEASNLVASDTNGVADIFLRDRQLGTTVRISVDSGGAEANGMSGIPRISRDGLYLVFSSDASNLVPGDTNGTTDAFLRDLVSGTTERISIDSSGVEGNDDCVASGFSDDLRFVAFYGLASNLVPGDTNGAADIFLRDRLLGTTGRVSVDALGNEANDDSLIGFVLDDGRYVGFLSNASNLVPGDTNGSWDVFLRDLSTGTVERLSVDTDGIEADGECHGPSFSSDGRFAAFWSTSTNLVPGDTNDRIDVFVRDRSGAPNFESLCDPGLAGVISCPCANAPSGPGRGCDNSSGTGGAVLSASGATYLSSDGLVFTTAGQRPTALSIVTQWTGASAAGVVFGMGVRCTSGTFKRLYNKTAVGGSITAPSGGDPSVSARSAALGAPIQAGQSRWYLVYYRDPNVLGGCPATSTFNATQTGRITWWP